MRGLIEPDLETRVRARLDARLSPNINAPVCVALSGGGDSPDGLDLKALKMAMYGLGGRLPDVLFDGYVNPARAGGPQICLRDVSGVVNADGPGGYKNPSKDATPYACSLPSLPAVDLKRG